MRRILGVNFRDKALNVSIIDSGFRVVKSVKTEEVVLPDKREEKDSFILESFKSWKKEYSPYGVVVGLPLKYFSHQQIDMPSMNRSNVRKALFFELEKYLPLPLDEYIFDFIALPYEKNRMKVLVFSIKRDIINELLKYMKESDLNIMSIRCSAIEVFSRSLDITGEKNVKGLFVNMTDNAYEIMGLYNSMPVFIKNFPGNIDLSREIERLLDAHPGRVYFWGNPDLSLMKQFNVRKFHVSSSNALAFSEVKKSSLNLNFLPQEYIKKAMDYYPYVIGGLAAATVIFFLFTGIITYYKDWRALRSLESKISLIKANASSVIETKKKLDVLQSDRKILLDFSNRSNISVKVLSDLSEVLPQDAWLINISVDDKGKIEIEGFTKKSSILVVALENSESFKNVAFSSPIITKNGEERFSLKMEAEWF